MYPFNHWPFWAGVWFVSWIVMIVGYLAGLIVDVVGHRPAVGIAISWAAIIIGGSIAIGGYYMMLRCLRRIQSR